MQKVFKVDERDDILYQLELVDREITKLIYSKGSKGTSDSRKAPASSDNGLLKSSFDINEKVAKREITNDEVCAIW